MVIFAWEVVQVIKEGLKYVSVALGELSAVTFGIRWMQVLFADSWDSLHMVRQPLKFVHDNYLSISGGLTF